MQNERKEMSLVVVIGQCLIVLFAAQYLMGCSNWQGAEFRIGIGQYNGAQETKTYTQEKK